MKNDSITILDGDVTEISVGEAAMMPHSCLWAKRDGCTAFGLVWLIPCFFGLACTEILPHSVCAYQIMISCSWSCLVVLYSTIFDIGGPFFLFGAC